MLCYLGCREDRWAWVEALRMAKEAWEEQTSESPHVLAGPASSQKRYGGHIPPAFLEKHPLAWLDSASLCKAYAYVLITEIDCARPTMQNEEGTFPDRTCSAWQCAGRVFQDVPALGLPGLPCMAM